MTRSSGRERAEAYRDEPDAHARARISTCSSSGRSGARDGARRRDRRRPRRAAAARGGARGRQPSIPRPGCGRTSSAGRGPAVRRRQLRRRRLPDRARTTSRTSRGGRARWRASRRDRRDRRRHALRGRARSRRPSSCATRRTSAPTPRTSGARSSRTPGSRSSEVERVREARIRSSRGSTRAGCDRARTPRACASCSPTGSRATSTLDRSSSLKARKAATLVAIIVDSEHAARRPGPDRLARAASTACATSATAPTSSPASRPGKGGQDVEGIPVFDTVAEAVARDRREHDDGLRPGARSPPTRSTRRSTRASGP